MLNERVKARLVADRIAQTMRQAKAVTCKRCGAECLQGEDDDRVCRIVMVDVQGISAVAEMLAKFDGIETYDLVTVSAYKKHLSWRDQWKVHSLQPQRYPILKEHHCDNNTVRSL